MLIVLLTHPHTLNYIWTLSSSISGRHGGQRLLPTCNTGISSRNSGVALSRFKSWLHICWLCALMEDI